MYYQKDIETIGREELEALQLERLKHIAIHCYENIPFYHAEFDDAGVSPYTIECLEDLRKYPFTYKQNLRDAYPFGMFAVPPESVVEIHASSGTTGQASVVGYTKGDLEVWGDCFARAIAMAGGSSESVLQVAYGYGLFTGGLGAHQGGLRMGCAVVPTSTGNTKRQVQIMKDFGTNILACTPSYALVIADTAREMGIDPAADLKVTGLVCGAEPSSETTRKDIAEKFGAEYVDIYGLSEIMGPGVAAECACKRGLHIAEDCFIFEIIDPQTLEPVPDGEYGEVVITTLMKECSPLIRYRTRDISRIVPGTCPCGRTMRRLDHIKGRTDDMLIIRGVNVFPSQIEEVIGSFEEIAPYYQITLTTKGRLDHALIEVETVPDFDFDAIRHIERLQKAIVAALKSNLQIAVDVRVVEPRTIARTEGKSVRVIDKRTI